MLITRRLSEVGRSLMKFEEELKPSGAAAPDTPAKILKECFACD
jgi:hypothetical protein